MHLYSETKGSGPDLVLVHGWGLHSGVWAGVAGELARDFRVTLIDLPGHGRSPAPAGLDLRLMAALLAEAAPERACWLGWSLGGLAAMQLALTYPERVTRLLMVASTPCFIQAADWPQAMDAGVFEAFAADLAQDYRGTVLRFLALQARGSEQAKQSLRALRELVPEAGGEAKREAPAALAAGLDVLKQTDLRPRLAQLAMPVHMLFGERDTLVPAGVVEGLCSLHPDVSIDIVPGAGHAPFISHPQVFVGWVRAMLGTAERAVV